jgi:hypothetical protein
MKTLEDIIHDLAKRGEISSIGLVFSPTTNKWRGSFAPCSQFGIVSVEDDDPVEALTLALTVTKKLAPLPKPKFDSVNPPISEMAQRKVTATVRPYGEVLDEMDQEYAAETWRIKS